MKIVHVYWSLAYGGIETMLVNVVNAQLALGAEVHMVIINDLYSIDLLNKIGKDVSVHMIKRHPGSRNLFFMFRLNVLLCKIAPDAVHLHLSKFYPLIWSRKLSRATSVTLHDLPRGSVRRKNILFRIFPFLCLNDDGNVTFIDKIPRVFSISAAVQKELSEKYGVDSIVVNNGISTKLFYPRTEKHLDTPMSVIMVSRLECKKKGHDLLIQAVSSLKGRIRVTFVGEGEDDEYLKGLVSKMDVASSVEFKGAKSQEYITEHLCEYDLLVQPSRWEGFGLTVAEAMAARVPVLVSSGQGPAEVTCGEKYGWVFDNGSVDSLVNKIEYIRAHYDEALEKANLARKYVCDTYDVSVTARKYLDLYLTTSSTGNRI